MLSGEMPAASVLDAVAQPARLRLLRSLGERDGASLAELAADAGVHPNTARAHLAELERSGVVERACEPAAGHRRGRPPARFRLAPGRTLGGDGFRGLAELLAAAVAEEGLSPSGLRRVGRAWGARLAAAAPGGEGESLAAIMERLGFRAELAGSELRLADCPCPLIAPARPELVCALADGVAAGALAASGQGRIAARKHDPERRCCRSLIER